MICVREHLPSPRQNRLLDCFSERILKIPCSSLTHLGNAWLSPTYAARWSSNRVCSTVIRFLWVSAKFSTCTVVRVNGTGTLVEDKMRRFKGECEHFSFNKCPNYTHDGASAKFTTNSQEMENSEGWSPFPHLTKAWGGGVGGCQQNGVGWVLMSKR